MKRLASGRGEVALHELRRGPGPTLLALHALGGSARDFAPLAELWPGRVLALDLPGHGASPWTRGGSYTPELHAAAADDALRDAGDAYLVGDGLGAYVALLLAGARAAHVPGAWLRPGRGLAGCGPAPAPEQALQSPSAEAIPLLETRAREPGATFDPLLRACETDARPPDYARAYADAARRLLLDEAGGARPPWWESVRSAKPAERAPADAAAALRRLRA
jgi:pimeloyl-ACP methyl ester carboxylesterase